MKKDWLNNFIEKNAWGLFIALIGLVVTYTLLKSQVSANTEKIKNIEQAQIIIVENQKDILELQVNQKNFADDVKEIKEDVKTLLMR
jgi:hypothetical protein